MSSVQFEKREDHFTSNGNAHDESDVINGSRSEGGYEFNIEAPSSTQELNDLVSRYQQLLQFSRDAFEKHQAYQKIADQLQLFADESDVESFVDPYEKEMRKIETCLLKISAHYESFVEEEGTLEDDILRSLEETSPTEKIDSNLLSKQLASLQLLLRNLDLPTPLQVSLDDTADDTSDDTLILKPLIQGKIQAVFERQQESDASFLSTLRSLGLAQFPTTSSSAPIGDYYKDQVIGHKISTRLHDLENLPGNLGTIDIQSGTNSETLNKLKIRALIELKALLVMAIQKRLKNAIFRKISLTAHYDSPDLKNNSLILQGRRGFYIREKMSQPNPELLALQLENKFKLEADAKKHKLQVDKINRILENTRIANEVKLNRVNKKATLTRFINNFHNNTEKDESKKMEKTAKQRLQALKANDEEAYIKLLDQTKDHRITHLLKQTNSFLDSLAKAVKVQQAELDEIVQEEEDTVDELREKIDYYQVAHRIKEEVKAQPSILVGGELKEYQLKGLQWMVSLYNNKLNGILADEMGLGKTIQSISLITYLIEKKNEDKFLVIVPLSTITNWTVEFEKWAPSVKVIVFKGSPQQRKELLFDIRMGNFQVMLTTYEYIIKERPMLSRFSYSHMIIDEGHRMKNAQSKLSVTLKQYYRTKNRLILTGTPLQNNLPELWALLNFVLPKIFNSVKSFDEWFNTPFANTGSQEKIELTEEESLLVIRRLHKVLRPFLLRRLKKDVEKDLPDKVEKVLKCNLSGLQHILYQQMLKHNALFVGSQTTGTNNKSGIKGLNNKIMQLRKICNHPFVFEEVEDVLNTTRLTNDLLWRTSGKFELLDRVLPKFKASGHKVLIFFQMTSVMNIFEDFLRLKDMRYLRLDGATKAEDRQDMLKAFNKPESDYFCFLLSTRAGGLGLNLQSADTVIIFDTDWNPHQDLQAQDRAHRIGQKNEVRILRLISNDSIEEVILERAHQKLEIDGKVIQAGKFDNKSTAEEQEEFLKRLLDAEQGDKENEENDSLDDDELNDILARSEDEKILFTQMDTDRMVREKVEARQGGYSSRLIPKDELPPVFTEDISHHFERDTKELSRMREKKKVKYDDGLTEEQWLMAMDDDNDTVEDAIRRKEEKRARRKRKAANGELEEPGDSDDGDEESDGEVQRKRARRETTSPVDPDAAQNGDDGLSARCLSVLDHIQGMQSNRDGHNLAEIFLRLPSKKLYADYYKVIKRPTAISQIRKHISQERYDCFEAFTDELKLMCSNAKTYNEEGSWVYQDAEEIEEYVNSL
ncbi:hypothetical protein C7M61_003898 [Candidozyma pseudohaemuli]|uniref:Nuclear protein STH1/NPS1 n=1 Tax=Candidozyma pseudohaemuli TaxID=418784 RepID=A0A2P7YKD7_9ASCO|nr:hypothetical protein C7M61_003898 [[Candida] pseudohaemulonii]PSK36427.1 hypothetical protein C7M61_003898 [[Candida] pseudohaemulonii]